MVQQVLQPVVALMLLTALVWLYMYVLRLGYILVNKIEAQSIASPEALNAALPERINRPSNNLKNLFELPVIFYAVCAFALISQRADATLVKLAWAYVALRAAHSLIQCTVNIVPLRFAAYLLSSLVLWFMVARLALAVS